MKKLGRLISKGLFKAKIKRLPLNDSHHQLKDNFKNAPYGYKMKALFKLNDYVLKELKGNK